MGILFCPEQEIGLSALEKAQHRDAFVRGFEQQFKNWSGIAQCCLTIKQAKDWETLGFHSFDAWLLDAAPCSRRYIYLAIELYNKLTPDIAPEELSEMPIGSAVVLSGVSPAVRQDPKAKAAAKKGKRELRKELAKDFPDQHIESSATLHLSQSLFDLLVEATETYQLLGGEPISAASFIELLVSDWLDNNRQRAAQLSVGDRVRQQMERIG